MRQVKDLPGFPGYSVGDDGTYPQITVRTGVKKSLASHVVTGRLWSHVA